MTSAHHTSLLLLLLPLVSCGEGEATPLDVCTDQVQPYSLPLFARCNPFGAEEQCATGVCVNQGWCAEPCEEDDDCIIWGAVPGHCSNNDKACVFFCMGAADTTSCPSVNGLQLVCGSVLCEVEEPCSEAVEPT